MKKITSLFVGLLLVVPSFSQISGGGGIGDIGMINRSWPSKVQLEVSENSRLGISTSSQSQLNLIFPFPITRSRFNNVIITFSGMPSTSTVKFVLKYDNPLDNIEDVPKSIAGTSRFVLPVVQPTTSYSSTLTIFARVESRVLSLVGDPVGYIYRDYTFTYNLK